MGLLDAIFGGSKETHDDGSTTERFSGGTSVTREADGSVRERTQHTTVHPCGAGEKITETYDGDGKLINTQTGWGHHSKK
jgi:hypothetical protein